MNTALEQRVKTVRAFNRLYTWQMGLLNRAFLGTPFSLSEARVLYELAQHDTVTAADLCRDLGLDQGYLSRILKTFALRSLIDRSPSSTDGRQSVISLSPQGQEAFSRLDALQIAQVSTMLEHLPEAGQQRLVEAMGAIIEALGSAKPAPVQHLLRPHRAGDMGWVVQRHGALYAREYGWSGEFEALVAGIVAQFLQHYDPLRERCWIAEQNGVPVGSVFLVKHGEDVAKLRLLLVEPQARGSGLGARLVEECVRFATGAGYHRITLWTNSVLIAARRLYAKAGFSLIDSKPYHGFGQDLVGETWVRAL